jgi:lipopolysaccharide export system protein LptC
MRSLVNTLKLRPLAIGIVALALLALLWQSDEQRQPVPAEKLRGPSEPDSFVVEGRLRSYSEEGQLQAVIQSPRIEQFDARNEAIMQAPKARLTDQSSGQLWRVSADHGRYELNQEVMHLADNVVVIRADQTQGATNPNIIPGDDRKSPTEDVVRLETDRLTLDNKKRIVHTEAPVVIRNAASVTRAVGMRGWVDEGIVQLESQVEGVYEPNASR